MTFVVFHQSGRRLTAQCEVWRTVAVENSSMLIANSSASALQQRIRKILDFTGDPHEVESSILAQRGALSVSWECVTSVVSGSEAAIRTPSDLFPRRLLSDGPCRYTGSFLQTLSSRLCSKPPRGVEARRKSAAVHSATSKFLGGHSESVVTACSIQAGER